MKSTTLLIITVIAASLYLIIDLTQAVLAESDKAKFKEVVVKDGVILIMSTRIGEKAPNEQ